jgi:tetratricopeptide (TPR) repeat protein
LLETQSHFDPSPPDEQEQIDTLLQKADIRFDLGDEMGALEHWIRILEIVPAHPIVFPRATRTLLKRDYRDKARELLQNTLDSGAFMPETYPDMMMVARALGDQIMLDDLREALLHESVSEAALIRAVRDELHDNPRRLADSMTRTAILRYPQSQELHFLMGEVAEKAVRLNDASLAYNRAVLLDSKTAIAAAAENRLRHLQPVITDRERGNALLAYREVAAIVILYSLLAFQDARLDVLNIGVLRGLGILLSALGGYLLVSATSSPQQPRLTRWLGGSVPDQNIQHAQSINVGNRAIPEATQLLELSSAIRLTLGVIGVALLALALWLVFGDSIQLLFNPVDTIYGLF